MVRHKGHDTQTGSLHGHAWEWDGDGWHHGGLVQPWEGKGGWRHGGHPAVHSHGCAVADTLRGVLGIDPNFLFSA